MRFVISLGIVAIAALVPAGCAGTGSAARGGQSADNQPRAERVTPEQMKAAEAAGDPYVCQTEADATTRVRKYKICKRQSEWEALSDDHQREMEGMRKVNINPCTEGGCPGRN